MENEGVVRPSGSLDIVVTRGDGTVEHLPPLRSTPHRPETPMTLEQIVRLGMPQRGLPEFVNRYRRSNMVNLWRGARRILAARALRLPHLYGALFVTLHKGNRDVDLGLVSLRVVTTAGVTYIAADIAAGAGDSNLFKYHGIGTGTNNEVVGDTALQTELTTEYASNSVRPTGSQGSAAGVYTTAATITPDSGGTLAITEHGIFSDPAVGSGTLLDRSKFAAVNLVTPTDSITTTYALTLAAGG